MNKRILGMLLALAMVIPASPAIASHTNNYVTSPVEHDDQGRSDEPDFATTSIFGYAVENKVFDPTYLDFVGAIPDSALPPVPPGHSAKLAPGCTDDSGRRPSGLCGLFTIGANPQNNRIVPPGVVGVQGMSQPNAPGRFSATQGTPVRFLDTLTPMHLGPPAGGVQYIELNRKLDDTGLRAAAVGIDRNFASDYLVGMMGMWSWYGVWTDKNGNGVLDELGPTCSDSTQISTCPAPDPNDEWWWVGNCFRFPSGQGLVRGDLCQAEPTQMLAWVYPGNHHTFSGGTIAGRGEFSSAFTSEMPGKQAICAVDIFHGRKLGVLTDGLLGGQLPFFCAGRYEDLESTGEQFFGDPVLDNQDVSKPDFSMADRTGDGNIGTRQWVAGNGFTMAFYDQSLLTNTVQMTGVFAGSGGACASPCDGKVVNINGAHYVDVDSFRTVSPAIDLLVSGTVKPAARSQWVLARDNFAAFDNANDAILGNAQLNRDPIRGPLDDQLSLNPPFPPEPNAVGDVVPAAAQVACPDDATRAKGWCNSYAAYQSTVGGRGYFDVTGTRLGTTNFVLVVQNGGSPVGVSCIMCVAGGGTGNPVQDGTPKPSGTAEYSRSLAPGSFLFGGNVGRWQDKPQFIVDRVYDPTCLTDSTGCAVGVQGMPPLIRETKYTVPADGWIGSIVNTTGAWRYRGYTTDSCNIPAQGGVAVRDYAICHPFRDGIISNPQTYGLGNAIGEFFGACVSGTFPGGGITPKANLAVLTITPLNAQGQPGTWQVPTFVDRDFFNQRPDIANPAPWQAKLEDWTGRGAITMDASCAASTGLTSGGFGWNDLLVLPSGNLGQAVRTEVKAAPLVGGVREVITDVDNYVAWGM